MGEDKAAELKQTGKDATEAARSGAAAFCLNTRGQERASRKRTFRQAIEQGDLEDAAALEVAPRQRPLRQFEEAALSSAQSPALCDAWSQLVSLKRTMRVDRKVAKAREAMLEKKVREYENTKGKADIAAASSVAGDNCISARLQDFSSKPAPDGGICAPSVAMETHRCV